jgi:hypothetical protein
MGAYRFLLPVDVTETVFEFHTFLLPYLDVAGICRKVKPAASEKLTVKEGDYQEISE